MTTPLNELKQKQLAIEKEFYDVLVAGPVTETTLRKFYAKLEDNIRKQTKITNKK